MEVKKIITVQREMTMEVGVQKEFWQAPPKFAQETYDEVTDIIADVGSIDRKTITPESHSIDDLGIDSLDFLDVTFAIDKRFGIKLPVEEWMELVNEGKADADDFFVMKNLVIRIDELRAAKEAVA